MSFRDTEPPRPDAGNEPGRQQTVWDRYAELRQRWLTETRSRAGSVSILGGTVSAFANGNRYKPAWHYQHCGALPVPWLQDDEFYRRAFKGRIKDGGQRTEYRKIYEDRFVPRTVLQSVIRRVDPSGELEKTERSIDAWLEGQDANALLPKHRLILDICIERLALRVAGRGSEVVAASSDFLVSIFAMPELQRDYLRDFEIGQSLLILNPEETEVLKRAGHALLLTDALPEEICTDALAAFSGRSHVKDAERAAALLRALGPEFYAYLLSPIQQRVSVAIWRAQRLRWEKNPVTPGGIVACLYVGHDEKGEFEPTVLPYVLTALKATIQSHSLICCAAEDIERGAKYRGDRSWDRVANEDFDKYKAARSFWIGERDERKRRSQQELLWHESTPLCCTTHTDDGDVHSWGSARAASLDKLRPKAEVLREVLAVLDCSDPDVDAVMQYLAQADNTEELACAFMIAKGFLERCTGRLHVVDLYNWLFVNLQSAQGFTKQRLMDLAKTNSAVVGGKTWRDLHHFLDALRSLGKELQLEWCESEQRQCAIVATVAGSARDGQKDSLDVLKLIGPSARESVGAKGGDDAVQGDAAMSVRTGNWGRLVKSAWTFFGGKSIGIRAFASTPNYREVLARVPRPGESIPAVQLLVWPEQDETRWAILVRVT